MQHFPIGDRNKIKRSPNRGFYDHKTVYQVLDAGFVCQVGFVAGGHSLIIPMSYGRNGNAIYLHGASTSRIVNLLALNNTVCISVTHLDGIVVARSMFDTSANYRSVVLFGSTELIHGQEKLEALYAISEHILPGRWNEVRQPNQTELKATSILKMTIESGSAKVRTGPPDDDVRDLDSPVWAGVIPLKVRAGAPVADAALRTIQQVPVSVLSALKKY